MFTAIFTRDTQWKDSNKPVDNILGLRSINSVDGRTNGLSNGVRPNNSCSNENTEIYSLNHVQIFVIVASIYVFFFVGQEKY